MLTIGWDDTLPRESRKRKHMRSVKKFNSVHSENNCELDGPPRLKKIANYRQKNGSSRKSSYSAYFSSILMRFLELSLTLSLAGARNLKYGAWVRVPKRETFLKLPKLCRRTMGSTARMVSHHSRYFLKNRAPGFGAWYRPQSLSTSARFSSGQSNGNGSSSGRFRKHPFLGYLSSLKWTPIPLSLGFALIAYQHYRRRVRIAHPENYKPTSEEKVHEDWEIYSYRILPWNELSRAWGWINSIHLPPWARHRVLTWYTTKFNCDMEEAEVPDLSAYNNLGELFRRGLKCGARPIDPNSELVSPSDGKLLVCGKVESGVIEQVKGVSYSLPVFLGPSTWNSRNAATATTSSVQTVTEPLLSREAFAAKILHQKSGTSLHYCVIYLAPGDYHRFHSPVNWEVKFRRHFAGELLSVNPAVAAWIGGLFSLNERAVYVGKWKHGFFSMTAVGATNVGSIHINGDEELHTNSRHLQKNTYEDKRFEKPLVFEKGQPFGEFNLGSTIVLLFEAPPDYQFNLNMGSRVKVGQGVFQNPTDKGQK